MYMHTLSPFMDELLSEERQLMKWVGIFQVGIFWWEFSGGGELDWGGILRVEFCLVEFS